MSAFDPQPAITPANGQSFRTSYDLFPPAARAAVTAVAGAALIVLGQCEGGMAAVPFTVLGGLVVLMAAPVYIWSRQGRENARYDRAQHAQPIPELYSEPKAKPRGAKTAVKLQKPASNGPTQCQ